MGDNWREALRYAELLERINLGLCSALRGLPSDPKHQLAPSSEGRTTSEQQRHNPFRVEDECRLSEANEAAWKALDARRRTEDFSSPSAAFSSSSWSTLSELDGDEVALRMRLHHMMEYYASTERQCQVAARKAGDQDGMLALLLAVGAFSTSVRNDKNVVDTGRFYLTKALFLLHSRHRARRDAGAVDCSDVFEDRSSGAPIASASSIRYQ